MSFSKHQDQREATPVTTEREPEANRNRTVVLLGATGNGKSTLGNFIVGSRDAFLVDDGPQCASVTAKSSESRCYNEGRELHVIDTPGFCDTESSTEDNLYELIQAMLLSRNGAHAIFICVNLRNRFSETDKAALEHVQQLGNMWNHAAVAFMNAALITKQLPVEEHEGAIQSFFEGRKCPKALKGLLKKVEQRYVMIEGNHQDPQYRHQKLTELMQMTDKIFEDNGYQRYSNRLFEIAKKHYDEAQAKLKQEALDKKEYEERLEQIQLESQRREEKIRLEGEQMRDDLNTLHKAEKEVKDQEIQQVREEAKKNAMKQKAPEVAVSDKAIRQMAGKTMMPEVKTDSWVVKALALPVVAVAGATYVAASTVKLAAKGVKTVAGGVKDAASAVVEAVCSVM